MNFNNKYNCNEQESKPFNIMQLSNKYDGKPIKFIDKKIFYELIFTSTFEYADEDKPLYNDLLVDLKDADKSKELHIWINSLGGSIATLTLLQSLIEQFEYIVTIGTGEIDSAGFMLWCLGDERYVYKNTTCMYHSLSSGNFGKAQQLKEYGDYTIILQQTLQDIIISKDILTQEEIEKGRLTQIWILGKTLIERNKAIDFSQYKFRESMQKIQGFKMDNLFYVKDMQGKYYESILVSDGKSKREIMQQYIAQIKDNMQKSDTIIDKVGQEFVNFIQNWIKMKSRIINGDGFITNEQLVAAYQGMYEPLTLQQLKSKLKKWCELVNLHYENSATKDKKKGFIIQINKDQE